MISHERMLEIFQPTIRFKTALHEYLYIWLYSHLNRLKANLYFNIFFLDIVDIDINIVYIKCCKTCFFFNFIVKTQKMFLSRNVQYTKNFMLI